MSNLEVRKFNVFDFDVTYDVRPNDDMYQEILPKEIEICVTVPRYFDKLTFDEQKEVLKDRVKTELDDRVLFDTPDEPYFEISDVDFCFEAVFQLA